MKNPLREIYFQTSNVVNANDAGQRDYGRLPDGRGTKSRPATITQKQNRYVSQISKPVTLAPTPWDDDT